DEADEMLDLGFLEDVETILSRCPSGRQTALFSATIPLEISRLAEQRMFDPVTIKVRAETLTIDTVDQFYVEVGVREKAEALARVLKSERPDQAIIFVRTKIGADRLARALGDRGVRVKALRLVTRKRRGELAGIERHANTGIVEWSANGGPPPPEAEARRDGEPERAPRDEKRERRQPRRPRHTKPHAREDGDRRAKLM